MMFRCCYSFCCVVLALSSFTQLYADTLRVGFGANRPPYVMSETHRGIEIDIVSHVLRELGYQVDPVYLTPKELHLNIAENKLDISTNLREKYDFKNLYYSAPYIQYNNVAVSKVSRVKTIRSIAGLAGYRIAAWQLARIDLGPDFKAVANQLGPYYYEHHNQKEQSRDFWNDKIDILIIDRAIFSWMKKTLSNEVNTEAPVDMAAIFSEPTEYSVGFRDRSLRDDFNKGLSRLRRSGGYQEIINHYLVDTHH